MIKTCFCAAALLIGAIIGANAPAEWRGEPSRTTHLMLSAAELQLVDTAMVHAPIQR
jgi:hypothetical protein